MNITETINEYDQITDLCVENFVFSSLSNNGSSIQSAWINGSAHGENIIFQTLDIKKGIGSTLQAPFSPSDPKGDANKYSLCLSLDSESGQTLMEFLHTLDEKVIKESMKKAVDYFKRPVSKSELLQMYTSALQQPSNNDYSPMVRVKIGDAHQTKIYKSIIPLSECTSLGEVPYTDATIDDIIGQSRMHIAIKLGQLWFYQKRFGVTLNAKEILLDKPSYNQETRPTGFSFGNKRKRNDNDNIAAITDEPIASIA